MPRSLTCPGPERWPALLDDNLPPEERRRWERHLEGCPACQERLDRTQEWGGDLFARARQAGDPTSAPADPTLALVLERLHEASGPDWPSPEPLDLYFLAPSDQPGVLGTLGSYEVQAVIGQGGMGVVLKAYEPALHRLVAIKVLSPALAGSATARRRFTREAQAAAAVCHDHIVAVHGVHEQAGLPYLVMQYVAGESLQDRLDRTGPLEIPEVVRIGLQTASALAAAHAQGLIHRDVKPANLLLENGMARVKITDFGLARMADDVGLTRQGVVAGTPEYMAPEQARGEPVDHRADLFSLGSVLYAMCTGRPPFRGSTALGVLRNVSDQAPAPLRSLNPEVPAWLEAFVARLMAKDPARRFQSAAEVAALLEGYLAHLCQPGTVTAPALPPPAPEERPPGRGPEGRGRRLRWSLGVLAALVLGLAGWLWLAGVQDEPSRGPRAFQEYFLSLQGEGAGGAGAELIGPDAEQCVRFEPTGVRIALPAGYDGHRGFHGERPNTGLVVPVGVKGDFEITVDFEILQEPEPDQAGSPQTRLSLDVGVDRSANLVTTLSRRVEKHGGTQFMAWRCLGPDYLATPKEYSKWQELGTTAKVGRLRLVRTGRVVAYHVAEGPDGQFTLLHRYEFSDAPLEDVQVVASTGKGARARFEARIRNLRIRAESLTRTTEAAGADAEDNRWVVIALAGALAVAVAGGLWLAVRRRRTGTVPPAGSTEAPAGVAEPPADPGAAAAAVAFRCPGCDKHLRARAARAGRQVKCPECGRAVTVPALRAEPLR